MDKEQIAHELTMSLIDKMLKDDKLKIYSDPKLTVTNAVEYYKLYKSNIIQSLK